MTRQFGAKPTVLPMGGQPEPGFWSVPITNGELVVSEATGDLRSALNGRPPVARLPA
jgi:hypothetical protein